MKVVVTTVYPFPIGLAGTNRIISFSKSILCGSKSKVNVFCIRPTEKKTDIKNTVSGMYNNIEYEYTSGSSVWPKNKLRKYFVFIKGIIGCINSLIKKKRNSELDVIITTQSDFSSTFFIYLFSKIYKVPIIYAIDEFPWVVLREKEYSIVYKNFYLKYFYKMFDGMIVMTNTLIEYYKKLSKRDCKYVLLPMSVESERFELIKENNNIENYIAYCGNLGHNDKDGVPDLIKAFRIIKNSNFDIKLYIIGDINIKDQKPIIHLKELVEKLELIDDVVFTGLVSREKMPEYLKNAQILALARPDNLQAKGGFPTKLGEYLCTEKPVVVTDVGEISDYLIHNVNAYIAKPNNPVDFAEKLIHVINNYDQSLLVAKKGKEVAIKYFDYRSQSNVLQKFLKNVR